MSAFWILLHVVTVACVATAVGTLAWTAYFALLYWIEAKRDALYLRARIAARERKGR